MTESLVYVVCVILISISLEVWKSLEFVVWERVNDCTLHQNCFTEGYTDNTKTIYNLGCKSTQDCFKPRQDHVIIGKRSMVDNGNCHQCCGIDECNTHLCSDYPVTPDTSKVCSDDPSFDCIRTSGFYNLCADVKHARTVCKKFCGLCNIVDGNWSDWTAWSSCDVTCEQGHRSRSRTCTNPAPADGGMPCVGNGTEHKTCNMSVYCPVDGHWNHWSPWSVCTVTCGPGLQRRERNCSNPYPKYGGNHCVGDAIENRNCFQHGCVDGGWSAWSSWGKCSVMCGTGITDRQRSCDNPVPSQFGKPCKGDAKSSKLCHSSSCSDIGQWSSWSSWAVANCYNNGVCSCNRVRSCSDQDGGARSCSGSDSQTIYFMIYQEKCKH